MIFLLSLHIIGTAKGIDLREPFNQFLKHIAQLAQVNVGANSYFDRLSCNRNISHNPFSQEVSYYVTEIRGKLSTNVTEAISVVYTLTRHRCKIEN